MRRLRGSMTFQFLRAANIRKEVVVAGDTAAEESSLIADTLGLHSALNLHHLWVKLTEAPGFLRVEHSVVGRTASRRTHVLQQGAPDLAQCFPIFTFGLLEQVNPLVVESQKPAKIALTFQWVSLQVDEAISLPLLYVTLKVRL